MVYSGLFTWQEASNLTMNQRCNLESIDVHDFVENQILTWEQDLSLSDTEREYIQLSIIKQLLLEKKLTFLF